MRVYIRLSFSFAVCACALSQFQVLKCWYAFLLCDKAVVHPGEQYYQRNDNAKSTVIVKKIGQKSIKEALNSYKMRHLLSLRVSLCGSSGLGVGGSNRIRLDNLGQPFKNPGMVVRS